MPIEWHKWLGPIDSVLSRFDPTSKRKPTSHGQIVHLVVLKLPYSPQNGAMTVNSIQDRTGEFRAVLAQVQKKNAQAKGPKQSLLTEAQKRAASPNGHVKRGSRSEFASKAAEIGRGITETMEKLERLAQREHCWILIHAVVNLRSGSQENAL